MPAVAKTTDEEVVRAARDLVARDGAEALSMQAVAGAVGLRAPSLYKRFPDRAGLLAAVERQVLAELEETLRRAAQVPAAQKIGAIGRAYRRFAKRHRHLYELLFSGVTRDDPAAVEARRRAVAPALELFAGRTDALSATRVFTAFVHGFVSMENAGEFRLGPDVDAAFELGLTTLARALNARS